MRRKFTDLEKKRDEANAEVKELFKEKQQLFVTIGNLEKEIIGLKKEIKVLCDANPCSLEVLFVQFLDTCHALQ
jgi:uncharacterized coiled-coil DUF342 family protein